MNTINIPIRGMHCASCEVLIGKSLKKVSGITKVEVSQKRGEAVVHFDETRPSNQTIIEAVREAGYEIGAKKKRPWLSRDSTDYKDLIKAAIILVIINFVVRRLNLFDLNINTQNTGVIVALVVGLVAGISTCMALVGGLVLGLSARHAELHPEATPMQKFRPHIYFNFGRILGYAAGGGVIGFLGQAFKPSAGFLGFLTMVIGGVMIFFGLKLIEIFPVLKDKNITLPSSVARLFGMHKEIKEYSHKSAALMGAFTFFLPCGFTQAMQLYAVSTGSFWQGATIMGLFAIGTAPGLLGIGGLTSVFKGRKARIFFMTAGLAIIILGWFNVTNGRLLWGNGITPAIAAPSNQDVQIARMIQNSNGYSPSVLTVEVGRPVKWIIDSKASFTCAASIVLPKYGISETLSPGENIITFTPTQTGEIPFYCTMGMYRGKFVVTGRGGSRANGATARANQPTPARAPVLAPAAPSCGSGGCGCGGGSRREVVPQVGSVVTVPSGGNAAASEQIIQTTYTYNGDISPNTFTVKKGQPVRFIVDSKENGSGCMSTILVPNLYDTVEDLIAGRKIVMTFTPYATGDYPITCAMGVPRGVIKVID